MEGMILSFVNARSKHSFAPSWTLCLVLFAHNTRKTTPRLTIHQRDCTRGMACPITTTYVQRHAFTARQKFLTQSYSVPRRVEQLPLMTLPCKWTHYLSAGYRDYICSLILEKANIKTIHHLKRSKHDPTTASLRQGPIRKAEQLPCGMNTIRYCASVTQDTAPAAL